MAVPRALILSGYGINCEEETAFAFARAGADPRVVHVNDLIEGLDRLDAYQILAFPGGFAYGDDTGSGKALANRIRNNLGDEVLAFAAADKLVIGICNGFQVMTCLGLLPGIEGDYASVRVALRHNDTARYECRWVDLHVAPSPCVFTRGIESLHVPVAHGEGKFHAEPETLDALGRGGQIVVRYAFPDGHLAGGVFPANPNGSIEDIAGICDATGRLFGLMPHPERHLHFTHREDWPYWKEFFHRQGMPLPAEGEGMKVFRNAVEYFR